VSSTTPWILLNNRSPPLPPSFLNRESGSRTFAFSDGTRPRCCQFPVSFPQVVPWLRSNVPTLRSFWSNSFSSFLTGRIPPQLVPMAGGFVQNPIPQPNCENSHWTSKDPLSLSTSHYSPPPKTGDLKRSGRKTTPTKKGQSREPDRPPLSLLGLPRFPSLGRWKGRKRQLSELAWSPPSSFSHPSYRPLPRLPPPPTFLSFVPFLCRLLSLPLVLTFPPLSASPHFTPF